MGDLLSKYGQIMKGLGTDGQPDLMLKTDKARYALEIKSMLPWHRRARNQTPEQGRINLEPVAWWDMCEWAESKGMEPALVAEVRINGAPNLYHWVPGYRVDQWLERSPEAKMVHIGLYNLPLVSLYTWRPGIIEEIDL